VLLKGYPAAMANSRLVIRTVSTHTRAPSPILTSAGKLDRSKNTAAFVTDFGDVNTVGAVNALALLLSEIHGRPHFLSRQKSSVYPPCTSVRRFYRFYWFCWNVE